MIFNMADGEINPYELAVLAEVQSEEYADEIIREFKANYDGGNPNDFLSSLVEDMDVDLLPQSIARINNEITNFLSLQ